MKQEKSAARMMNGLLLLSLIIVACFVPARAQTSVFTYQGRLTDNNVAANGTYRMQFALFDGAGVQIGSTLTFDGVGGNPAPVSVTNGAFTVPLNFGSNPFLSGADRFVEIHVFNPATNAYVTLTPRQQLTSSPYSIRSLSAAARSAAPRAWRS